MTITLLTNFIVIVINWYKFYFAHQFTIAIKSEYERIRYKVNIRLRLRSNIVLYQLLDVLFNWCMSVSDHRNVTQLTFNKKQVKSQFTYKVNIFQVTFYRMYEFLNNYIFACFRKTQWFRRLDFKTSLTVFVNNDLRNIF